MLQSSSQVHARMMGHAAAVVLHIMILRHFASRRARAGYRLIIAAVVAALHHLDHHQGHSSVVRRNQIRCFHHDHLTAGASSSNGHNAVALVKAPRMAAGRSDPASAIRAALSEMEPRGTMMDLHDAIQVMREDHDGAASTVVNVETAQKAGMQQVTVHRRQQFSALRASLSLMGGQDRCGLLASLLGSVRWDPGSGRSHSEFYMTKDGSYLLKQMRPEEVYHFHHHLAGPYFAHMADAVEETSLGHADLFPSLLVPTLGIFTITSEDGKGARTYALMENIRWGEDPTSNVVFDLKGSQRNRKTSPTAASACGGTTVLLDENLFGSPMGKTMAREAPFACSRAESSRLLGALKADTEFLASCNVMDYSLIVAMCPSCSSAPRFMVGVVDYFQPYTRYRWAETTFKSAAVHLHSLATGSVAHTPTIIDPQRYRQRFMAMAEWSFSPDDESASASVGSRDSQSSSDTRKSFCYL